MAFYLIASDIILIIIIIITLSLVTNYVITPVVRIFNKQTLITTTEPPTTTSESTTTPNILPDILPTTPNIVTNTPTTTAVPLPKLVLGNTQKFTLVDIKDVSMNRFCVIRNEYGQEISGYIRQFEWIFSIISNNKNKFLTIGFGNSSDGKTKYYACYSTDLISWTPVQPFGNISNPTSSVMFGLDSLGNDMFVMIRKNSNQIAYSPDAINWIGQTIDIFSRVDNICWGAGTFVATGVGLDSRPLVAYSQAILDANNKISWSQFATSLANFNSFIFANDMFIIQDNTNKLITSSNGINWSTEFNIDYAISSGGAGKYFSIGADNILRYSSDLINWTVVNTDQIDKRYYDSDNEEYVNFYLSSSVFGKMDDIDYIYVTNSSQNYYMPEYQIYRSEVNNLGVWEKTFSNENFYNIYKLSYMTYNK